MKQIEEAYRDSATRYFFTNPSSKVTHSSSFQMAKDQNYWEPNSSKLPGVDEAAIQAFESHHSITLPPFLKEMYQQQNGGEIKNSIEDLTLFPIRVKDEFQRSMRGLEEYVQTFGINKSIYLDWIEEEFEDPGRVIIFADSYGHVNYALDYSGAKAGKEPPIVRLDFECVDKYKVAPTFGKWLNKISKGSSERSIDRTNSKPSTNWNEIEKYDVLYRSSFRDTFKSDGAVQEIENVLCKFGERGLIHFVKRTVNEQVVTLDRCSIVHGVHDSKLKINKCRPDPVNTFGLKLESLQPGDINWMTNELDSFGSWKTNKSKGPPYFCTVESQDHDALEHLAAILKEKGFAGIPKVEDHLDPEMKKLWERFTGMGGNQRKRLLLAEAKSKKRDHEPDLELPVIDTIDPSMKTEDENLAELTRIILSWAGQVHKIQTAADAHLFIEEFQIYWDRFKDISRYQGRWTDLDLKLRTVKNPLREEIQSLLSRDRQAHDLVEKQKREIEWDACRPLELGDWIDKFLTRYQAATQAMADHIKTSLEKKTFDWEAFQPVFKTFEDVDEELTQLSKQLGTQAGGWVLRKRRFGEGYRNALEQLELLKTKHRSLYRKDQENFLKLSDLLMT